MRDWYPLSFDSQGNTLRPEQELDGQPDSLLTTLRTQLDQPITDLWILSYGWNNSIEDGDAFYTSWVDLLRAEIDSEKRQGRISQDYQPLFVGIYWPSKILADTTSQPNVPPAPADPVARTNFINAYQPIFAPEGRQNDPGFARDFGTIYDFLSAHPVQKPDASALDPFVAILKKYQLQDPHADQPVMNNLADAPASTISQGITDAFSALSLQSTPVLDILLNFLRVFSFWTMKARAGTIGVNGLGPIINSIKAANSSVHIHLVGHSFGAKLVTAAVYAAGGVPPVVDSLILFQGAFSQFAFSRNVPHVPPSTSGFYTKVIEDGMVTNPLAIIYSTLDLANKDLYPLGMAPILDYGMILFDLFDPREYHKSSELRGAIGANGIQGVDDIMLAVTLPWTAVDRGVLDKIRCINLNRTPFVAPAANPNDNLTSKLIGAHNDYSEPEIFHGLFEVSLLNRNV